MALDVEPILLEMGASAIGLVEPSDEAAGDGRLLTSIRGRNPELGGNPARFPKPLSSGYWRKICTPALFICSTKVG